MVNDEEPDGSVGGLEFQTQLDLEGLAEVGRVVSDGSVFPGGVMSPGQGEVVESREACLIDDGARDHGESGHGRERRGQEGKRNSAATIVLAGRGGWNMRDDAADGRKIAHGGGGGGGARRGG